MPGLAWLCPACGTTTDSWKQRIGDRRGRALAAVDGRALPSWGSAIRRGRGGLHRRPALQRIRGSNGLGIVVGGRSLWGLTRHGARLQSGMNADRIVIE